MKWWLFILGLIGIFVAGFLWGSEAGRAEAARPDYLDRAALRHIILAEDQDAGRFYLHYVCNNRVLAYAEVAGGEPEIIFDEEFVPPPRGFLSALFRGYKGHVIAALGGGLSARLNLRGARRVIVKPQSAKAKHLLTLLVTGVSGAYAGYQYGLRDKPACDSPEVLRVARSKDIWKRAKWAIASSLALSNIRTRETKDWHAPRSGTMPPSHAISGLALRTTALDAIFSKFVTRERLARLARENARLARENQPTSQVFVDYLTWVLLAMLAGLAGFLAWLSANFIWKRYRDRARPAP